MIRQFLFDIIIIIHIYMFCMYAILIFPFCQHDFRLSTHEHTYTFPIQRLEIRHSNIRIR